MKIQNVTLRQAALAVIAAIALFPVSLRAAEGGVAGNKPIQIYLLSGQSNMTGRGNLGDLNKPAAEQKATLVRYIMEPQNVEKYKFLYKDVEKKGAKEGSKSDMAADKKQAAPSKFVPYGKKK